jgi:transcriptional regulator with XRE-family HTH domain
MEKQRHKLRVARIARGLSQRELAKKIGVTRGIISDWERGKVNPYPYHVGKLCSFFGVKDPAELDLVREIQDATSTPVGNQPDETADASAHTTSPATMETVRQSEKENNQDMDPLRRITIQGLVSLGLAGDQLFVDPEPWERLSRAMVKPASMNPESFAYFQQLLECGWGLSNAGELQIAEQVLASFLPKMIQLAPYQQKAAFLTAEGMRLRGILAAHQQKLLEKLTISLQAVEYARQSDNASALVAELTELAVAFEYVQQPKNAFKIYQEALSIAGQSSPLIRSRLYGKLTAAFAREGQVQEAFYYIREAYEHFPAYPEQEADFLSSDHGIYKLARHKGLMYLAMNNLEEAFAAFDSILSYHDTTIPERSKLEILNDLGRTSIKLDKKKKYVYCLKEGLLGSVRLKSKMRFDEVIQTFQQDMPRTWLHDPEIKQIAERLQVPVEGMS